MPTTAEMVDSLLAVVTELDAARDLAGGDFAPDSPAKADWSANEMPGTWGPQLLQDAYRTAELYGASTKDHVLAMADAIGQHRPFAIASLARALSESAARAVWLLEPNLDPIERVRRLLNDILYAAFENDTLWAHEPRVSDNADVRAKVKQEATTRGLVYTEEVRNLKKRQFQPARIGDARPSTQWLLGYVTKSPDMAKFYYRAGSAVLHAALHGFDQRLAYTDGSRRRAQVRQVDAAAVLMECTYALQVYVAYLGALMSQTGWQDAAVLAAIDKIEAIWQRIATPQTV